MFFSLGFVFTLGFGWLRIAGGYVDVKMIRVMSKLLELCFVALFGLGVGLSQPDDNLPLLLNDLIPIKAFTF